MTFPTLIWGAPNWVYLAVAALGLVALAVLLQAYLRAASTSAVRTTAASLKTLACASLLFCLLEPSCSGIRPRPGTNLFVLLADNSQSLQVRDQDASTSRGQQLQELLKQESLWQTRLGQDFDIRRYRFDRRLESVDDFASLAFDGSASSLATSLETIARRFQGRPVAGVLLFTDGNATDIDENVFDAGGLPPVYPVLAGADGPGKDISVNRISVSQTSFEAAPVTVMAEIVTHGYQEEAVVAELLDDSGEQLQQQIAKDVEDGKPFVLRFQLQPEQAGVSFYRLRAFAQSEQELFTEDDEPAESQEATLANNSRLALVDRGGGPYRVLYVSGRANWEFKFLRRALEDDAEVNLVGLIRVAKREPKFEFRSRRGESTNPLFRGFGNEDDDTAEQYDEPVLLRLGTVDQEELRHGFPKAADQLYRYDAVILDDLEAQYFTQDQMLLLQRFVSHRGGGFLMLGGNESFAKGNYERTPIGEMLPVYLDRLPKSPPDLRFRLSLTQEGWLQPWIRVRANEEDEQSRLNAMPDFETVNRVQGIKPGATVLATVTPSEGKTRPALVTQRFGKGRASALLMGDMWRWALERDGSDQQRDLEKTWRQTLRWLVANVPRQIELDASRKPNDPNQTMQLTVRVNDVKYEPLDNASVSVRVTAPDGSSLDLTAEPSEQLAGVYETAYVPRQPGAYRARATVAAADGSNVGQRDTGWATEPATEEFRRLAPNPAFLERIASETGGEVVPADGLAGFVSSLQNRKVPVTEHWISPLWHHWAILTFAILCLTGEWGVRRWKGLP